MRPVTGSGNRKYARVERERRFLLATAPVAADVVRTRRITDRYFEGTRLRLRRQEDDTAETIYKLTQKIRDLGPGAAQGMITNTYLTRNEYELLARLPALDLRKTRYSVPPFGVDVFAPPLHGLVIAEIEFEFEEDADAFPGHPAAVIEVTTDERFTGGSFVRATRADLRVWLAKLGIQLADAT